MIIELKEKDSFENDVSGTNISIRYIVRLKCSGNFSYIFYIFIHIWKHFFCSAYFYKAKEENYVM